MKSERSSGAIGVLYEVSQSLANMPEHKEQATSMRKVLDLAAMYLMEYAKGLGRCEESYDALLAVATARGGFDELKADLMEALAADVLRR